MATRLKPGPRAGAAQHRRQSLVRLGLRPDRWDYLVALAGNPNVGKTTVFNGLTGLRQHTGNWPGKTVVRAEGAFAHNGKRVKVVDLPGTYSLQAGSTDEEVARDFIVFGRPDVTVVVVDATRLERNLNLVLQILEITDRVVVCLNLVDEARRHGVLIDPRRLERELASRWFRRWPGGARASTSCWRRWRVWRRARCRPRRSASSVTRRRWRRR